MERDPHTPRPPGVRRRALARALVATAAVALSASTTLGAVAPAGATDGGAAASPATPPGRTATVMTRNLYLGAELGSVLQALASGNPQAIVAAATATWQQVVASDPAERMAAVADEIVAARPHAVGLQEVTEYTLYDYDPGTGQTANPVEAYDLLDLLLAELAERGASYRVVAGATADNFTSDPIPILAGQGFPTKAVQLLDRDVILVRSDVRATNGRNGSFEAVLGPQLGFPIVIDRGWGSADLEVRGVRMRFVNSHTEAFGAEAIRVAEVQELFAAQAAVTQSSGALPTVYAGDFNSDAPPMGQPGGAGGYLTLLAGGLHDLWVQARPEATDARSDTCCQDADLGNETSVLDSRIDLLLGTHGIRATSADRVGDVPVDLPGDTWWASDHAGVVATVVVPPRR